MVLSMMHVLLIRIKYIILYYISIWLILYFIDITCSIKILLHRMKVHSYSRTLSISDVIQNLYPILT